MEAGEIGIFWAIAFMAIFAFALSAMGRRWRKSFGSKPLSWLDSLEKRTSVGRWIFIFVGFLAIFAVNPGPLTGGHRGPWVVIAIIIVVGITGGIANMLRELSDYAKLEIEVRKRLSPIRSVAGNSKQS